MLAKAPFPAPPLTRQPAALFYGDTLDLRVEFQRQDDRDLEDMIGADVDYYNDLPVEGLTEYGQLDMAEMPRRSHAHHLKTVFAGIVRGSDLVSTALGFASRSS